MKRTSWPLAAAFVLGLCLPARGAFESRPVGARAVALGQAFTAGTNDATSVYWNPAALSTLKLRVVEFSHEDLYTQGLVTYSNLSFAHPDIGPGTLGISWTRLGATNKVPFDYSENTYTIGYGSRIFKKISIGGRRNM